MEPSRRGPMSKALTVFTWMLFDRYHTTPCKNEVGSRPDRLAAGRSEAQKRPEEDSRRGPAAALPRAAEPPRNLRSALMRL